MLRLDREAVSDRETDHPNREALVRELSFFLDP
jgi:hypothetical protein